MAKIKITPQTDQALKALAARLRNPEKAGKVAIKGSELLANNPDAKDDKGNPINPKQTYYHLYPPAVNHLRRMRKAYEQGANKAVNQYLKPYLKQEVTQ